MPHNLLMQKVFEQDFVGVPLFAYPDGNLPIMGMRKATGCRLVG